MTVELAFLEIMLPSLEEAAITDWVQRAAR